MCYIPIPIRFSQNFSGRDFSTFSKHSDSRSKNVRGNFRFLAFRTCYSFQSTSGFNLDVQGGLAQYFITPLCHILITVDHHVLWTLLKIYLCHASRQGKVHILRMTDEVIPVTCLVISHSGWHSQTSPVKSAPDFRANSLGSSVFFQPITQSDEQT